MTRYPQVGLNEYGIAAYKRPDGFAARMDYVDWRH
jgi:hypothetical protein